jgi:hypothetical protein
MLLLIIGQIFLVGAIIKSDSVNYNDVKDWDEAAQDLEMKAPEFSRQDLLLEQLPEDQMPEPELSDEKDEIEEVSVALEKVEFRSEESYEIVDFILGREVKIFRKNQGGKLLRLRVIPAIEGMTEERKASLESRFEKFSFHETNKYSEMLFAAGGRIGNPYIASDSAGLFRLTIPYLKETKAFLVPGGEKVADGVTYYRDRVPINGRHSDVHILRIEPFSDSIKVLPVLANEGIAQKEVLSSMSKRYNALAAINGAYFTSRGDPIGTLIISSAHRFISDLCLV